MVKIKFFLNRNSKTTSSIFARINFGAYTITETGKKVYKPFQFFIGKSIKFENWNVQIGRAVEKGDKLKGQKRLEGYSDFNTMLQNVENRLYILCRELEIQNNLTHEAIRITLEQDKTLNSLLNKNFQNTKSTTQLDVFKFIENFISSSIVSNGTKKDYNNTLGHLRDFILLNGNIISWKSIDVIFFRDFVKYLSEFKKQENSTINKEIKNLKRFLSEAEINEIEVCQDFKKRSGKKSLFEKLKEVETETVYLTEHELELIYNHDFHKTPSLERVRDLFILACWTGLRYSDLSNVTNANLDSQKSTITFWDKKTKSNIIIPLEYYVVEIFEKYNYILPRVPTNQVLNRMIRNVCEEVQINSKVTIKIKENVKQVEKWTLIASHTGRRSFATNLFRRGIPTLQLMKITGHKTEKAFLQYIRVSKTDNAEDIITKGYINTKRKE